MWGATNVWYLQCRVPPVGGGVQPVWAACHLCGVSPVWGATNMGCYQCEVPPVWGVTLLWDASSVIHSLSYRYYWRAWHILFKVVVLSTALSYKHNGTIY